MCKNKFMVVNMKTCAKSIISIILGFTSNYGIAQTYNDFNIKGGSLIQKGIGPSINQTNQRLEIVIPANSKQKPEDNVFNAVYQSTCFVQGDFDIQTDYFLLNAPVSSGVRLALTIEGSIDPVTVQRTSFSTHDSKPAGEYYVVNIGDTLAMTETTDRYGKLRLKKEGDTITGFFYDKVLKNWTAIGSGTANTEHLSFGLAAWSHDAFFDKKYTKIAFDNVFVTKGVYCQFMGN